MNNQEMLGTLVLVHPNLENHPAGREGDIGIVAYIDELQNEVYLRFTDEAEAIYPSDAIFLLKDHAQIFSRESSAPNAATLNDYKDLYKIATLQDFGRNTDIWNALEIARDNPDIWLASLVSVKETLGIKPKPYIGR